MTTIVEYPSRWSLLQAAFFTLFSIVFQACPFPSGEMVKKDGEREKKTSYVGPHLKKTF